MGAAIAFVTIMVILIILSAIFRPHIDETSNGDIILWYYTSLTDRDYIMIWKN